MGEGGGVSRGAPLGASGGISGVSSSTSPSGQSVNIDQRVQQTNPSSMQSRGGIRIASCASSQLTSQMSAMSVGSTSSSLYHPSLNQSNQPSTAICGPPYGFLSHVAQNCSIAQPPPPAPPNGLSRPVPLICPSNANIPPPPPPPAPPLASSSSSSCLWPSGNNGPNTCSGFSYHQAPQPAKVMPGDLNVSPTSSTSSVDSLQTPLNHRSLSSSPSAFSSAIGDFSGPRTQAHFYPSNSPVFPHAPSQQHQQQQLQQPQQQLPTFHPVHLHHHQLHSSSQQPHVQMTPASLPPSCHPASLDPQNLHQQQQPPPPPPPTQPQLPPSAPVGRRVRTLYECIGENPAELSFEPNSIIYNVRPSREPGKWPLYSVPLDIHPYLLLSPPLSLSCTGWLQGTYRGKTGLIPENYVEFID